MHPGRHDKRIPKALVALWVKLFGGGGGGGRSGQARFFGEALDVNLGRQP